MKFKLILLAICICFSPFAKAICLPGEIEVTITIHTDDFAYEGYWALVPSGNNCGTGTIFSGGNSLVGCTGGGANNQSPGGYANDTVFMEGPFCLTQGNSYDIIYVDDYGDGGFHFTVTIGGYPVYSGYTASGDAPGSRFTFTAKLPPSHDAACYNIKNGIYIPYGNNFLNSWISNKGTDTIHSIDLFYSVDQGSPQNASFSGITISPFDSLELTHTMPWNVSLAGNSVVKLWVSNPNNNIDSIPANDTTTKSFTTGPSTPNIIDDYIGATPVLTVIGNSSDSIDFPRDLDFHPILSRNELWVILKSTASDGGTTVKFSNAGLPGQTSLFQQDGNAWHFMSLPTAIAFSENGNFATAPGIYDANHGSGDPFTGPTLWSSDTAIYAQPSGGNGSHIDMLHQSPFSMGICSEEENVFWVFDDHHQDIVLYDFVNDHGPGNSDHGDGIIRRFSGLGIAGDPAHEIPSHLVLDKNNGMLYIADTDHGRILKMDINSHTFLNDLTPYESVAEYSYWSADTWNVFADSALNKPCGIDLIGDRLIVSDYTNGNIIIYDKSGNTGIEIGRIVTGTPGVMGIKIGPDGKIWYVNALTNEVIRVDNINTSIAENTVSGFSVFPNPASSKINMNFSAELLEDSPLKIYDNKGSLILEKTFSKGSKTIALDVSAFANGVYTVIVSNSAMQIVRKLVKK